MQLVTNDLIRTGKATTKAVSATTAANRKKTKSNNETSKIHNNQPTGVQYLSQTMIIDNNNENGNQDTAEGQQSTFLDQ